MAVAVGIAVIVAGMGVLLGTTVTVKGRTVAVYGNAVSVNGSVGYDTGVSVLTGNGVGRGAGVRVAPLGTQSISPT